MDYNTKYLLILLKSLIKGTIPELPYEQIEWKKLQQEARGHNINTILYKAVSKLPKEYQPDTALMQQWKEDCFKLGLKQLNESFRLNRILKQAKQESIKVFVVKGVVLADLYPEPLLRCSGDVDLIVAPKDESKLHELLVKSDFILDQEASFAYEKSYYSEEGMNIEVHTSLWEEAEGDRRSRLESLKLIKEETIVERKVCDIMVPTLAETQHLIYLIYHMIKHFCISGIGIRHLLDVVLFVNYHKESIDFAYFWESMRMLGYEKFCHQIFYLGINYLNLDASVLPKDCNIDKAATEKMLEDIMDAGTFGGSSVVRWKSGRFLRFYYENEHKKVPKSQIRLLFTFMFPKSDELDHQVVDKYTKSKFLPLTWIRRGIYYFKQWKSTPKSCSLHERAEFASKRIDLLKDLKLLQ